MRVLDIAPDGSQVRMWISAAMNIHDDTVWHPKALFEKVTSNVGYPAACFQPGLHGQAADRGLHGRKLDGAP